MKTQWVFAAGLGLIVVGVFLVNQALAVEFMGKGDF
jgi:hypothetical protein